MTDPISADDLRETTECPSTDARMRAETGRALTVAAGDRAITIRFEDERWAASFTERYADMLVPDVAELVHDVVRTEDGYLFWSPGGRAWAWEHGPLRDSVVAFFAECTALATLIRSSPLVSFHAAALRCDRVAVAIAGDSGAGKTTTALACVRRGMRLYSDERALVSNGLVVPFPRAVHIRAEGARLLAIPYATEGRRLRISALLGPSAIPAPAPLAAVFLLSGCEERPRLERAEWFELAPALLRWMDSRDAGLARVARLRETLREARCFRLFLGAPDATASLILSTAAEVVPSHAR
jgi:hypothetical protein